MIGAGPAGSLAATLLARGGWSVTLIEQHRFPRDKVCGECLSALGMNVLERAQLGDAFRGLRPVRLRAATIHTQSGRRLHLQLPRPMWGASRRAFDSLLLDAARSAGVKIVQPARCESIQSTPNGALARIRDLVSNSIQMSSCDCVILADGKAALMPWSPSSTSELGIKAHFQNIDGPRDAIELFGCANLYGGLAAIEDGSWNAAFSVPAGRVRACAGNLDALFAEIVMENPTLRKRMVPATRVGRWLAAPLPRFAVQKTWPQRVIPIGNAAAALEPIGGEGMGLALRSAEIAAQALLEPGVDGIRDLPRRFARLWSTRSRSSRAAAVVVANKKLSQILPTLGAPPGLGRLAAQLIGK